MKKHFGFVFTHASLYGTVNVGRVDGIGPLHSVCYQTVLPGSAHCWHRNDSLHYWETHFMHSSPLVMCAKVWITATRMPPDWLQVICSIF